MKAAVFTEPKCINIQDVNIPVPNDDEVLLEIEGCGICGSNMPTWEGREWFKYPMVPGQPGHEGWGTVVQIGKNVTTVKTGDKVSALTYNAFSQYDIAKESAVVKIPGELQSIPFPGEPLGCTMNIFKRSNIEKGDKVAIIGIGFLGSMLTQLAHNSGAEVIAISRRDYSLKTAKHCGAAHLIQMDDHWKIIEKVKEITNGEFCDKVIEATGLQWPIDLAGELTKIRGRLIIAGFHQDGLRQVNMQLWNWRGLDVINAHERDENIYIQGIKDAMEAVKNKTLNPEILYTNMYKLEDINYAFKDMNERPEGFMKALIINN